MAKLATLTDDFNDGVLDPAKWVVTFGAWSESGGTVCATTDGFTSFESVNSYDFTGSYAQVEAILSDDVQRFQIYPPGDASTYVDIIVNNGSDLRFRHFEANVLQTEKVITYDPVEHRWWRMREQSGTVYYDTSPDGVDWTNQFQVAVQPWMTDVVVRPASNYGVGEGPNCFDNFNLAPGSEGGSRTVPVGSEFEISAGELSLARCGKEDEAWPYLCDQMTYNGLRKSEDPCGLWVEPPGLVDSDYRFRVIEPAGSGNSVTQTITLSNPDPCRTMLYYLPVTAGVLFDSEPAEPEEGSGQVVGDAGLSLSLRVAGVDLPDDGSSEWFSQLVLGNAAIAGRYFWTGQADFFWTAPPNGSTDVEIEVIANVESGTIDVINFQLRVPWFGISQTGGV